MQQKNEKNEILWFLLLYFRVVLQMMN